MRLGAGGGIWNGDYFFAEDPTLVPLDGRELHGNLSGKYKVSDFFGIIASAKIYANRSSETFIGWYPSWVGTLSSEISLPHFSGTLGYNYRGHRIDLNQTQQRDRHELSLEAVFRPNDYLKFKITGTARYSDVRGYKSSNSINGNLGASMSYNPVKFLWIWAYGGGYSDAYHYFGGDATFDSTWLGAGVSLDY